MISSSDVAKLRAQTGAGMMDCKNALEESNGNLEQAGDLLRKKGIAKAAKREGKIATEGTINVKIDGNIAVVLEINSETDFVAKNDDFKTVVNDLTAVVLKNKPNDLAEALRLDLRGKTAENYLIEAAAKIGEKISLRRLAVLSKDNQSVFGAYIHMCGKIGALVVLSGSVDEMLAHDIAIHIAAADPKYLKIDSVPPAVVTKEEYVYAGQLKIEGKPDNIIVNILRGKLAKFYSEVCLLEQSYIKDDKKRVKEILPAGVRIKEYVRFELGEGLEKKEKNFIDEVNEQLK